ncbi:hypothetical protein AN958_03681, partial [Leucoagaricus sp. SymC.cos]
NIPPHNILAELKEQLPQAWLDGAKSVVDFRYNDSRGRIPLWTVQFWVQAAQVQKSQVAWRESFHWLEERAVGIEGTEAVGMARSVLEALDEVGWNSDLTYQQGTVSMMSCTTVLGNIWLTDENLSVFSEEIQKGAKMKDGIFVADVLFATYLEECMKFGKKFEWSDILRHTAKDIQGRNIKMMLFPINTHRIHWVAGFVDFAKQEIGYGDSLWMEPATAVFEALSSWLNVCSPAIQAPDITTTPLDTLCNMNLSKMRAANGGDDIRAADGVKEEPEEESERTYGEIGDDDEDNVQNYKQTEGPQHFFQLKPWVPSQSKSAIHERKQKEAAREGTLPHKPKLDAKWKADILSLSKKNGQLHAHTLESLGFFKKPMPLGKSPSLSLSSPAPMQVVPPIIALSVIKPVSNESESVPRHVLKVAYFKVPCDGLSVKHDGRILQLLQRVSGVGGGGEDEHEIAKAKYGKSYSKLTKEEKEAVSRWQHTSHKRSLPQLKNQKFVNKKNCNEFLGELYIRILGLKELIENSDHPYVQYALGALSGTYDNKVFGGLIHVVVQYHDHKARGVGLQNFKYSPSWDEICQIIQMHSSAAYRGINEDVFTQVKAHLDSLNYSGPVCLTCNDTKLLPTFRLYWDAQEKTHFLVGGVDGPIQLSDSADLQSILSEIEGRKATKLCLWTITLSRPCTMPLVVAALPITNTLEAQELAELSLWVIKGLIQHSVKVVSYICDGAKTERNAQQIIVNSTTSYLEPEIPSPREGVRAIKLRIPVIDGQPIAMIQDSKHTLKTFRNNLFSGAHLLTLGDHVAAFNDVLELSHEIDSPLYKHDVERLDRQDDNAATQLFLADNIKSYCNSKHHDQLIAVIEYLFMFGDAIDGYQSQTMMHEERLLSLL